jgi:CheY-like chemotaxis protein
VTVVEMNSRQELLARLDRLQTEIVVLDGLLKSVCGTKVCARLMSNLLETVNAIEALLLVNS